MEAGAPRVLPQDGHQAPLKGLARSDVFTSSGSDGIRRVVV